MYKLNYIYIFLFESDQPKKFICMVFTFYGTIRGSFDKLCNVGELWEFYDNDLKNKDDWVFTRVIAKEVKPIGDYEHTYFVPQEIQNALEIKKRPKTPEKGLLKWLKFISGISRC